MQIHVCLNTFMVETRLLLLYRLVAYVRFLGGQHVYIYFHKIRPMALRLQTKDAHTLTVHESISIGCLQSDQTYLYVIKSAVACSTRILYFRIRELNFPSSSSCSLTRPVQHEVGGLLQVLQAAI